MSGEASGAPPVSDAREKPDRSSLFPGMKREDIHRRSIDGPI